MKCPICETDANDLQYYCSCGNQMCALATHLLHEHGINDCVCGARMVPSHLQEADEKDGLDAHFVMGVLGE